MIDQIVGSNIARLRRQSGLSISRLAEECSMFAEDVEACERGARRVCPSELISLAKALKVELLQLFDGALGTRPVDIDAAVSRRRPSER